MELDTRVRVPVLALPAFTVLLFILNTINKNINSDDDDDDDDDDESCRLFSFHWSFLFSVHHIWLVFILFRFLDSYPLIIHPCIATFSKSLLVQSESQ